MDRRLARALASIVGEENVLVDPAELLVYEADGSLVTATRPDVVVFPGTAEEVAGVMRLAREFGVPIVPRGSGTSLSGGAQPVRGGIVLSLARMNRILEVDLDNEVVVVEPAVINAWVNEAVQRAGYAIAIDPGYQYAPDPGSQRVSTVGGNVGHNSGGIKCFKYGVTVNHVRGLEVVLPNGEVRRLGGKAFEAPGLDLTGLFVGSEGTLGVVTKVTIRVVPLFEAVKTILATFDSADAAGSAVSALVRSGVRPLAVELMDKEAVEAVESGPYAAGLPRDAEALLLIDVEGSEPGASQDAEKVASILRAHGANMVRLASDGDEAQKWWAARKQAFGAMGFVGPNYVVEDGTVPRKALPLALNRIREIVAAHGLRVANVFHAGDGNLHPLILYDERDPAQRDAALRAGEEVLRMCVELGGTITGEHGVGWHKRRLLPLMYSEVELDLMRRIKAVFDPDNVVNPGKVLP